MKSNIISCCAALLLAAGTLPAQGAEVDLTAHPFGLIAYGSGKINLKEPDPVRMEVDIHSRVDYTVSSAAWVTPVIEDGRLILEIDGNSSAGQRVATLEIRTALGKTAELRVTQGGITIGDTALEAINARRVRPVAAAATSSQSGEGPNLAIDDNYNTFWHSNWNGFDPSNSSQWPKLTFVFSEPSEIASARYYPRPSSESNGNWKLVRVYLSTDGSNYSLMDDNVYDLKGSSNPYEFKIPEAKQKGIKSIRFEIQSGVNTNSGETTNFASCAEMEFFKPSGTAADLADLDVFTDGVCSALKSGVNQARVDEMTDPFYKELARLMLNGTYSSEGMVSEFEPLWNVETLSEEWNAPGKYYDRTQGATGVMLGKGKYAVIVEGLPEHMPCTTLKVLGWYAMPTDGAEKGWASEETYPLVNGINIINRTSSWEGLAYVGNYDTEGILNGTASDIKVHIVGGAYNGVLSNTKTNSEMQRILDNAVYPCIDLVGSRVHSVWEVNALKTYTKDQYVRYINVLDQLIIWEHRLLGLEKYNRVPNNKTLAYVNYDYYMYQGGRGVTFMYNTQSRVCSPDNLMSNDDDAIWGLSHEWGHQHQLTPYFRWTGMAEVTNNIFSAYNVCHMGYPIASASYRGRYPKSKWETTCQKYFVDDNYNTTPSSPDASTGETKTANSDGIVLSCRNDAKKAATAGNAFAWSPKLKQFAIDQPIYPTRRSADPKRALNAIEAYSGDNGELILAPYVNMMYYFMEENATRAAGDERPTLIQDLFEALRLSDDAEGSTVEKKDGVDKYELLASIFNGNRSTDPSINKTAQFKAKYPQSKWVTEGYLPTNPVAWQANSAPFILNYIRKASRLTGYNLWSYFERFGVFTVCAIEQGDYGTQYYIMTEEMYDEFKADMEALVADGTIRELPESVRTAMTYCKPPQRNAPVIPNDRPLTADEN